MRTSLYKSTAIVAVAVGACQLAAVCQLAAKDKPKQKDASSQDQIVVNGHISVSGGPIVRFVATQHYDRSYVYAERGAGQPVTLLDVTKASQPAIVSQLDASSGTTNLVAVAGTAAVSTDIPAEAAKAPAQTIRLMDFSDPANPKVTRQFDGVTAVERLSNGMILLANSEGVWVLTQHFAQDPKAEERYARQVIYGDSMY
jgi:hypothetical protein